MERSGSFGLTLALGKHCRTIHVIRPKAPTRSLPLRWLRCVDESHSYFHTVSPSGNGISGALSGALSLEAALQEDDDQ